MTTTTADAAQRTIRRVLDEKRQQPGALLPILHAIQDAPGHVPPAAAPEIAGAWPEHAGAGRPFPAGDQPWAGMSQDCHRH